MNVWSDTTSFERKDAVRALFFFFYQIPDFFFSQEALVQTA